MMTNKFIVVPNSSVDLPEGTFPVVFNFVEGRYKGWFVCLENIDDNGKFSCYVLRVPKDITDKEVVKNEKRIKKIMAKIVEEILKE